MSQALYTKHMTYSMTGVKADYLWWAEMMAEIALICARSSSEELSSTEIAFWFPEEVSNRKGVCDRLREISLWFQKASKDWKERSERIEV